MKIIAMFNHTFLSIANAKITVALATLLCNADPLLASLSVLKEKIC